MPVHEFQARSPHAAYEHLIVPQGVFDASDMLAFWLGIRFSESCFVYIVSLPRQGGEDTGAVNDKQPEVVNLKR